jgi:hypothetical protein
MVAATTQILGFQIHTLYHRIAIFVSNTELLVVPLGKKLSAVRGKPMLPAVSTETATDA